MNNQDILDSQFHWVTQSLTLLNTLQYLVVRCD